MGKILTLITLVAMYSSYTYAQQTDSLSPRPISWKMADNATSERMYNIKPWIDIPATVALTAFSLNGFRVIYGRDEIPLEEILALDKNNVNRFDRSVTDNYSEKAKKTSDYFFYGSMPLPLFLLLDKDIRKDGPRVGLLYVQALGVTGLFYTGASMIADRIRPISYNPEVPMDIRRAGGQRNSFPGGHPALVATSVFFMAKVYSDYHPEMRHKWVLYTLASGLTLTTAYLRLKAGYHFKTDLIAGVLWGAASGILVPHIHKNKAMKNSKLALFPNYRNGQGGFTAYYKLGKQ